MATFWIDKTNRAIEIDPGNATAFFGRGHVYDALGSSAWDRKEHATAASYFEKAVANLDRSIALNAEQAGAFRDRAHARWWLMFSRSLAQADIAKTKEFEVDLKDAGAVMEDYNRAIRLDPTDVDAYVGRAEAGIGNWQQRIDDYTKAISLNPNSGYLYYLRAEDYERIKRPDLGQKDREKSKELGYKPEQKSK